MIKILRTCVAAEDVRHTIMNTHSRIIPGPNVPLQQSGIDAASGRTFREIPDNVPWEVKAYTG